MTTKKNESDKQRQTQILSAVTAHRLCTKRYGRATVTINRWGGLGELGGKSELTKQLEDYREGQTSAEQVGEAFISARLKGHSPTFRRKEADPARLLQLVADCSTEPTFAATDAKSVADTLVAFEEEQREKLAAVMGKLASSIKGAAGLGAFSPAMRESLLGQHRSVETLRLALGVSPLFNTKTQTALAEAAKTQRLAGLYGLDKLSETVLSPTLRASMRDLQRVKIPPSLLATYKPPNLPASLLASQAWTTRFSALEASFRIKPPLTTEFARQARLLSARPSYAGALANIAPLTRGEPMSLGAVVKASESVAAVIEQEGAPDVARELRLVTNDVVAVAVEPRLHRLEDGMTDVKSLIERLIAEQKKGYEDGLVNDLVFFILNLLVAFVLWRYAYPR